MFFFSEVNGEKKNLLIEKNVTKEQDGITM